MSHGSWKEALGEMRNMCTATFERYPSLRMFVYEGTIDLWRADAAFGEVEEVELKGRESLYTLWSRSAGKDRVEFCKLAYRAKDEDGAGECHELFDIAGDCLKGKALSLGGATVAFPSDEDSVHLWVLAMLRLGDASPYHPFLKWTRILDQLPAGSQIHLLKTHPMLACKTAMDALQKVDSEDLPDTRLPTSYTSVMSQIIVLATCDLDARRTADQPACAPLSPEELATCREHWRACSDAYFKLRKMPRTLTEGERAEIREQESKARAEFFNLVRVLAAKCAPEADRGSPSPPDTTGSERPVEASYNATCLEDLAKIPEADRTRPMTFAEAAEYLGAEAKSINAAAYVKRRLPGRFARISRKLAVFNKRDFPMRFHDKISP